MMFREAPACWWLHTASPYGCIQSVASSLRQGTHVLIADTDHIPWFDFFMDSVILELTQQDSTKRIEEIHLNGPGPEQSILESFASSGAMRRWRPGKSAGTLLGSDSDSDIHDSYIVLRARTCDLDACAAMIRDYAQAAAGRSRRASFLLLCSDPARTELRGIRTFDYGRSVMPYDIRACIAQICSFSTIPDALKDYGAELAGAVCDENIEQAARLINRGLDFLRCPASCAQQEGVAAFSDSAVWQAQLRVVLPVIERFRQAVIRSGRETIEAHLDLVFSPVGNVESADNVEIGPLCWLIENELVYVPEKMSRLCPLFRDARNDLSHLKPVDFEVLHTILEWDSGKPL